MTTNGGAWSFVGADLVTSDGTYNLADTGTIDGSTLSGFGQGTGNMTMTRLYIGFKASGTVNVNTTGTLQINDELNMGNTDNQPGLTSKAVLNIDSGTVNSSGFTLVGNSDTGAATTGTATINIAGGSFTSGGAMVVGQNTDGIGVINLMDGVLNVGGNFQIGQNLGGDGTLNMSGGALNLTSEMWFGDNEGSGAFNLSGGTVTANSWVTIGRANGTAVANQTGGTLIFNDPGDGRSLLVGQAGQGTWNLDAGLVDVQTGLTEVGESNIGVLNLNGGQWNSPDFLVAEFGSADGTMNLNGGILQTASIRGGDGVSTINFNGSQVIATAGSDTFLDNIDTVEIFPGGMNVDTNGFDLSGAATISSTVFGTVTKTGEGTLDLLGANTYVANHSVNGGTLGVAGIFGGHNYGNFDVTTNAGMKVTTPFLDDQATAGTVDYEGDGNLDFDFGNLLGNLPFATPLHVTATAGEGLDGGDLWSAGVTAADINGDGKLDLYINNYMQPNQLFLNMGKGENGAPVHFRECAKEAGLDVIDCSHSAGFADYDGDGRLDVYLLTNRIEDPDGTPSEMPIVEGSLSPNTLPTVLPEKEKMYHVWRFDADNWGTEAIGSADYLFRQTGVTKDGVPLFENTTEKAGISGMGDGLSLTWWDPDADGDPDLYVANDFISADCWYRNNGDGTFTDIIADRVPHTPWFSMGADFGDVNGDGQLDLLVADMSATSHFKSKTTMGIMGGMSLKRSYYDRPPQLMRNMLYLSNGTDRYEEGAYSYKVSSTDWTWAVKFADYDLDGWQDVYFTNGISRHMNDSDITVTQDMLIGKHMFEFWKEGEMRKELNRAYRNKKGEKFDEVSKDWGIDHMGVSYGSALGDLDLDGDPDLVTVNLEEPQSIYINNSNNPNRIAVRLRGHGANTDALNATVRIRTAAGEQIRHLSPLSGYLSCNEPTLLFGLGDEDTVKELSVHWPHGGVTTYNDLTAGHQYTIVQDQNSTTPTEEQPDEQPSLTHFVESPTFSSLTHSDAGWENDFIRPNQSLLPWALSQLGPTIASADIDGDGDTDFFIGSAAGELARLRINQGDGRFTSKWVTAFAKDKSCEDAAAVFFDADGDEDADLFVVGGSNDFEPGSSENRDRLYLNDGKGGFEAAPEGSIPADSLVGSAVSAADFDRDGDLDLFVGTRVKPWDYPISETSRLLINHSKDGVPSFADASPDMMPALDQLGLVTAATAVDIDRDGWVDLLTASEWGPVRVFLNKEGKFVNQEEHGDIGRATGFWNSLAVIDIDHDGDLDIAAGNMGLNTKYKQPQPGKPHLAYYGDFDGNGCNIVEVKREGDMLYPERGRSCSSNAMPFIQEKFGTFKEFAVASLEDIYTEEKLTEADRYSVSEFQSGWFVNEGDGTFTFKALPRAAQIAPIFGMSAGDFTGDGHPDLVTCGNFLRGPQIETGPFGGGVGMMLVGDGKGNFSPKSPSESGIVLSMDHRALVRIELNGDGRPDFLASTNDGPLKGLVQPATANGENQWLAVRLPHHRAAGATVTFTREGNPSQTVALPAGGGYWSQEDSVAWFGLGEAPGDSGQIEIHWPDGKQSSHDWTDKEPVIFIAAE
ncbi:MAG: FG-GAP-like repeat-containing protein [Verrucomicrobiota bacterium]